MAEAARPVFVSALLRFSMRRNLAEMRFVETYCERVPTCSR